MRKKIFAMIFAFALVFSSTMFLSAENTYAEGEKTFVLKKADGTELGQYDEIDGWDEKTILGMMKTENTILDGNNDGELTLI